MYYEKFVNHLKFALWHIDSAMYAADKKAYEERMKEQNKTTVTPTENAPEQFESSEGGAYPREEESSESNIPW